MRRPTLAVLNMMDVAAKRGLRVDADALSHALGIPVIRAQASKGIGKQELYSAIAARHGRSGSAEIVDYGELETDIREISRLLPRQGVKGYPSRWFAIKLLEQDSLAEGLLASVDTEDGRIAALTRQCRESWRRGTVRIWSGASPMPVSPRRGTSRHAARNAWSSSPR